MTYPDPERVHIPLMYQRWCDITFLHWRFPIAEVSAKIPHPFTVESFDGSAWVGVTPFVLKGLRPPLAPALPWISCFPETNCRTYVRLPDGSSGVWFFSLDAARAPAVAGGRLVYRLPYVWSRMRVQSKRSRIIYESDRRWPARPGKTRIAVEPGEPVDSGALEIFLTARFRLFSLFGRRLVSANVEHAPWPLRNVRVLELEQSLTAAAGLSEPAGPPIAHFSPGVQVRIGAPHLVRTNA